MKKLMILGAGILQLPAILKAKEMGLEVIAVDQDKDAVGFLHADVKCVVSTIDIEGVAKAADHYGVDGIMTLATDMPVRSVAAVCDKNNLPGLPGEAALLATDKSFMRERLREKNIDIPAFYTVSDYEQYLQAVEALKTKIIVKPTDNSGSKGIYLLQSLSDAGKAYRHAMSYSRSGKILVEEYMQGPEVSVEAITQNNRTHIIAITDKITTGPPNFVEMGHSQQSRLDKATKNQIEAVTIETIQAIGINQAASHTELKITENGVKVVEIGARLGGDHITTKLVPLSTGIDLVKECIKLALGEEVDVAKQYCKGAAVKYIKSKVGTLRGVHGYQQAISIPGVQEVQMYKREGEHIGEICSSGDRIGCVISQGCDAEEALRICDKALNTLEIVTD
ncbi:ATP-grasp domain-containing protein [Christensenella intestinihominis]|uniref:ATP-grasp domain-containing protein n=1 Tax=Christensenella intestinihominis TaxID=1851429 RepID=UPI0009F69EFB|nr:ATP-grasp domain-containing protein [Christensenella intestinihominis]